jgi:hypothetical protein
MDNGHCRKRTSRVRYELHLYFQLQAAENKLLKYTQHVLAHYVVVRHSANRPPSHHKLPSPIYPSPAEFLPHFPFWYQVMLSSHLWTTADTMRYQTRLGFVLSQRGLVDVIGTEARFAPLKADQPLD